MSVSLIVECARARPDDADIRRAAVDVADWSHLLDQAAGHGMTPLLYACLSQASPDLVPAPILGRLRESFHAVARGNLKLAAELVRLVALFDRAGIEVVPFKGPAVAWSLYQSPALRQMSDLDLLIRPCDTSRTIDLLISAGYQPPQYPIDLRFFQPYRQMELTSGSTGVAVDLHWSLSPPHLCDRPDMEGVWTRLAPVQVAGRAVRTLGNADLLIFLCIHGAKHVWRSLHWLADLARLIDRAEMDWDGLIAQARARRISRMVFAGLLLAVDLLAASVPADVVNEARADPAASRIAARAQRRIVTNLPFETTIREEFLFQLSLIERTADKLRYCWGRFNPTVADRESLRLPAFLFPAYYAFRPLRLIVKYNAPGAHRLWANTLLGTRLKPRMSAAHYSAPSPVSSTAPSLSNRHPEANRH
jgi:hypothetical protein